MLDYGKWIPLDSPRVQCGFGLGAHYSLMHCKPEDGMALLREFFEDGPDSINVVLFSTSGVHGSYATIEDAELALRRGGFDESGEAWTPKVTFMIIQTRICCLRYGNCLPLNLDDIEYLKRLRLGSHAAIAKMGVPWRP